jgi:uncharacterized membrane protein (UPF0136 family)
MEVKKGINAFQLKLFAIVAMTFNHAAHAFCNYTSGIYVGPMPQIFEIPLGMVGGVTFPIMAFLIVEGYRKTSNLKKYMGRLLLFGAAAVIPFFITIGSQLNVMFTLLLGLIGLVVYDRIKNKVVLGVCFAAIIFVAQYTDWGIAGVLLILAFGILKDKEQRIIIPITIMAIAAIAPLFIHFQFHGIYIIIRNSTYFISGLLTIPLLLKYNGERGPNSKMLKYGFYAYYPTHLLILGIIKILTLPTA